MQVARGAIATGGRDVELRGDVPAEVVVEPFVARRFIERGPAISFVMAGLRPTAMTMSEQFRDPAGRAKEAPRAT